ncbi:MAG: tRNA lysidine(34) synthetase TilS, partial [Myxococcota bacterium]
MRLLTPKFARKLMPPGSRVLVALSGGPDSQALLHALAALRGPLEIELFACAVDHGLRPDTQGERERARSLADELGVAFQSVRVELEPGRNVMDAARRARRRALIDAAREHQATRIALGHTATDVAETVLMNLSRGTSLRGAGAMRERRGRVIRPLLRATREETRAYCIAHGVSFADDPANRDTRYNRPFVRHAVLPALKGLNPDVERALARFARDAHRAETALTDQARGFLACTRVQFGPWARAPSALPTERIAQLAPGLATRVIREFLEEHRLPVNERRIHRILGGLSREGFELSLGGKAVIGVDRGHLFVVRRPKFSAEVIDGMRI